MGRLFFVSRYLSAGDPVEDVHAFSGAIALEQALADHVVWVHDEIPIGGYFIQFFIPDGTTYPSKMV